MLSLAREWDGSSHHGSLRRRAARLMHEPTTSLDTLSCVPSGCSSMRTSCVMYLPPKGGAR